MSELSTADCFVKINESLGDMIKYVANEPSVGLYYIQQHAHNAVPNVIKLKNNVMEKSHEVSLHTEDLEDSIAMTRSMKECGFPIIDEMIREIKTSLTLMSTKQRERGGTQQWNSSYQLRGSSPWGPVTGARSAVSTEKDDERGSSYFSNVLKAAREKAGNLRWPPLDVKEQKESAVGDPIRSNSDQRLLVPGNNGFVTDGQPQPVLSPSNDYDEFKAVREARLEEWLGGSDIKTTHLRKEPGMPILRELDSL